jgi:hypothetical protein
MHRLLICLLLFAGCYACTSNENPNTINSVASNKKDSITKARLLRETDTLPNTFAAIQSTYELISNEMNNGLYDSSSFNYNCHDEKKGLVRYYTKNGQLRMIMHRYNAYDHYTAEDYYYVMDSTLFFSYRKSVAWAFESGPAQATRDEITEQRTYWISNKPVKCLEKKYVIHSQASNNPHSETVANKEVNCDGTTSMMKPFQLLVGYRYTPTAGCL